MDGRASFELAAVIDQISLEDRRRIAELNEEQVVLLHHGLGTWVRNLIRAGEIEALFQWSSGQNRQANSLDDKAWPILVEIWKSVRASQADTS